MKRDEMIEGLAERAPWDLIVIGGGATGLGTSVDASARGYRTLLLEQGDFAQGTSSRSTKLIHGGVRYLQQGNLKLVRQSLRERGLLSRNAPQLVSHLAFVVPNYTWWEGPFYGAGLKLYDTLAGRLGLGPSRHLTREEALERLPTLEPKGLRGGTIYYDGQFDDARLAIALAQTAAELGGSVLNYFQVTSLLKNKGRVCGVGARDLETGREYELAARGVVNATGVFSDAVRRLDERDAQQLIVPSQGAHIVLPRRFLPGESAIMVPKTDDHRVLFAIPWHGRVLVGTTETPVQEAQLEPRPLAQEIEFLITHAARYLTQHPTSRDVLSAFAGLRPLIQAHRKQSSALLSRDHLVLVSPSGLVSITGGKWTTYRKMAEDTVDRAARVAGLPVRRCRTAGLGLAGQTPEASERSRKESVEASELLHPELPYRVADVIRGVREEMARRVEDVLARRTRLLVLDARASIELAPKVARLMASELGRDAKWEREQTAAYKRLAAAYVV